MEGEADVAKFVLESRKASIYLKVTKQRHLQTKFDKTRAWYVRQKFGGYKIGFFSDCQISWYFSPTNISHYTVLIYLTEHMENNENQIGGC